MKPLSTLTRAAATSALVCAATAMSGAGALAQDHTDNKPEDVMDVDGAYEPAPNETVQDNDLLRAAAEAWDNADLDRAPYTDDHQWVGLRVNSEDGGELGEIERVRLSAEGDVEAIVVETGGTLDLGGHEVQIGRDAVSFTTDGSREAAVIEYTRAEFEALPHFNEDAATEFPLSDDDYDDNENELELDDTPSGS